MRRQQRQVSGYLNRSPSARKLEPAKIAGNTKIAWQQQHESMQRPKNSMHMRKAAPLSGQSESISLSKVG
jgi:hypothetical protein